MMELFKCFFMGLLFYQPEDLTSHSFQLVCVNGGEIRLTSRRRKRINDMKHSRSLFQEIRFVHNLDFILGKLELFLQKMELVFNGSSPCVCMDTRNRPLLCSD